MKIYCLILSTAIAGPALAQSSTTYMPDGSKDITVSATLALVPRAEGSKTMHPLVLPSASVEWSPGVFLEPGTLGMQLSDDPNLRYGPVLDYDIKNQRSDDPVSRIRLALEPGAFVSYRPVHNLSL